MQNAESKKPSRRKSKPKGLGDVVENITEATGIKKAVELFSKATGLDCGCDARKAKLNKLFPLDNYKPKKCMTETQYEHWKSMREISKAEKAEYTSRVYPAIASIHAALFEHRYHEPCSCSPRQWDTWREDIEKVYNTYEEEAKK